MDAPPNWGATPDPNASPLNGKVAWLGAAGLTSARFVERPLLQAASFHLFAGRPGVGKGALCARWISRCTNGEMYGVPRNVLWLSSEEDAAIDLGPRVEAAGGDRRRVALIPNEFLLPRDAEWLEGYATDTVPDVGLIVIDPLANHTGSAQSNIDEEVRLALQPLASLASSLDIPVIGVRHLTVKEAKGGALAAILGSTAWVGVSRVVLAAVADEQKNVHVHPIKGNRVPTQEAGRKYRLEGMQVADLEESVVRAIEMGESTEDIDELLEKSTKKSLPPTKRKQIEAAMVKLLRSKGGEMESDKLDSEVAQSVGTSVEYVRKHRGVMKTDLGWLRVYPDRDGDRITKWMVTLTNAAPNNSDLDDPSRAHARGESVHKSSLLLSNETYSSLAEAREGFSKEDNHGSTRAREEDQEPPAAQQPLAPSRPNEDPWKEVTPP